MSIQDIQNAKNLKAWGRRAGREGMADRVIEIMDSVNREDYREIMKAAGRIRAITTAARCDHYWDEKVHMGFMDELYRAETADVADSREEQPK